MGSVAGEAGRVAHVMGGVMQGLRLRKAGQEYRGCANHGDKQNRHQRGGFAGSEGLRGHYTLHTVTPDGV